MTAQIAVNPAQAVIKILRLPKRSIKLAPVTAAAPEQRAIPRLMLSTVSTLVMPIVVSIPGRK
jgi:hypothetical protein